MSKHTVKPRRPSRDTAITLFGLAAATSVAEIGYRLGLGPQNAIIVYVLAIFMISIITDGYAYGIFAAIAGVFVFDYLITPPRLGFSFTSGFPMTLSIMLLVTLVTSSAAAKIKIQAQRATAKEQRADLLYQINDHLLSSRDVSTIAEETSRFIREHLQRCACLYPARMLAQSDAPLHAAFCDASANAGEREAFLSPSSFDTAVSIIRTPPSISFVMQRQGLFELVFIPLVALGQVVGVLGVAYPPDAYCPEEEQFLTLFANQAAQALQVEKLTYQQQQATILAETEKARNRFLRAISHDLRTPLTSMIGASSALLENDADICAQTRAQLIRDIHDDAEWLLSMVQNILSATRMQSSNMALKKTDEAAEEVLAETVAGVRKRFVGCHIAVHAPGNLLIVPMDAMLIAQVLSNLLENALRHAQVKAPHIWVSLEEKDGYAEISIADNGLGISAQALPFLFDVQPNAVGRAADASRHFGMGLSICKTIVEAHNGWIAGKNLPQGGAEFRFALPLRDTEA